MPYFWIMMSSKEKLRFVALVSVLVFAAFLYIKVQNVGPIISSTEISGIIHSIQATSPISGVASAFAISVKLANGKIASVEVPTRSKVAVGNSISLVQHTHAHGRNRYVLNIR